MLLFLSQARRAEQFNRYAIFAGTGRAIRPFQTISRQHYPAQSACRAKLASSSPMSHNSGARTRRRPRFAPQGLAPRAATVQARSALSRLRPPRTGWGGPAVSLCTRTRPLAEAAAELGFLQNLSATGDSRPRVYGTITHWERDLATGDRQQVRT